MYYLFLGILRYAFASSFCVINSKTQDPFVALVSAAFSFLWVAEALNSGKKTYFWKPWVFVNRLTPGKLRINATFRQQSGLFWPLSSQFRPYPQEKCFLAWTVAVSFGLRTFPSIFSLGMRTYVQFLYERNSTVYGSSGFRAQARRFRCHLGSRFLLSS